MTNTLINLYLLLIIITAYYLLARHMAYESAKEALKIGFEKGYKACQRVIAEDLVGKYELDLNAPEHQHIKELLEEKMK